MAKALGTSMTVEIDDTGAGSYTAIENIKSADFSFTVNEVDCTDNDDAGVESYLAGNSSGTFSFVFNYDVTKPTGQAEAETAAFAKTTKDWRYRPDGNTSGADEYTFDGFVTEYSAPAENEGVLEVTVTVRVTGAVVRATI